MPNRIIKESICSSESIDSLSWFEEIFFYRLIVNADDFGRFDARTSILKARLFPLKDITNKQIENALNKLSTVGMVQVYMYDQKPFLQLCAWSNHQTIRNKKSKYPSPNDCDSDQIKSSDKESHAIEINCDQSLANVPVIQSNPNPIRIRNAPAQDDRAQLHPAWSPNNNNEFPAEMVDKDFVTLQQLYKSEILRGKEPNNGELRKLADLCDVLPASVLAEVIHAAVETARGGDSCYKHVETIAHNWAKKGIKTVEESKSEGLVNAPKKGNLKSVDELMKEREMNG